MVKVERSFPAPASLAAEAQKKKGTYECPDVVERLAADFHNKCYICELRPVQDPEIEHLLPHKGGKYPERKFDWNNLFWSCGHCNSVKKAAKYDEGILDCCAVDPEEKIAFLFRNGAVCVEAKASDALTERTLQLVDEVFNKTNTGMRVVKCQTRTDALNEEMLAFLKTLSQYQERRKPLALRTLKGLLDRKSQFAAFKREYVRQNCVKYPELLAFLR